MLPTVWRINIKTAAEPGTDPRQFCIDQRCLGVGWRAGNSETLDWQVYEALARAAYPNDKGWWPALNALRNRMRDNDLCWTRDIQGIYYLGRIDGPWEYIARPENLRADVVNIRHCEWLKVGPIDAVPGKVVSSFRPNRTAQRVDDETVRVFSAYFYNCHTQSAVQYKIPPVSPDIFALLSDEDCEDLVALYMQLAGYVLLASTCKSSTAAYEFVMRHSQTGERAAAQVKTGYHEINMAAYSSFPGKVYLFSSKGRYTGERGSNIICLSPDDMTAFLHANEHILPERVMVWLAIARDLSADARTV
jgi:hypothetical protein